MKAASACLLLLALACAPASTSTPPPVTSDTQDGLDLVTAADLPITPETPDHGPDVAPLPKPIAPLHEPTPRVIATWRVATLPFAATSDPVLDAIETLAFTWPADAAHGLAWSDVAPKDNGEIKGPFAGAALWAVTRITTPEPTNLLVRADAVMTLFLNGARQPGDVYQSGKHRLPLRTRAGENLLIVRGYGSQRTPSVALWTTPDAVAFNFADATLPDLVAGDLADQWIGVPVLHFDESAALPVTATVVESTAAEATTTTLPALPGGAVTQVAFRIRPRPGLTAGGTETVTLYLESPAWPEAYERTVDLPVLEPTAAGPFRRTFRSDVDASVQYYAVRPPPNVDPTKAYGLVLSLHGAGVEGSGQAAAYAQHERSYVVAATNRRPFGFDWEVWGRLDALEVLDRASAALPIDPTRVYLGGHSMGGHGTWQVGTLFPGRFAVIGPSAGWISFYTYGGQTKPAPTSPFGWAARSSDTLRYVTNLKKRGVYIIHGVADDNVPVTEARKMKEVLTPIVPELHYHEQPGAGHWWDGEASPGADCVDWPPFFALMDERTLDPFELDFTFVSSSPWVNPRHSYVTIQSQLAPNDDATLTSVATGAQVTLTTTNVRSLTLNGKALADKGVTSVIVDGATHAVVASDMPVGPTTGKRPGVHGPLDEVFMRPFCLVTPDAGAPEYARYAAWLLSTFMLIGNGHGCALPASAVTPAVRAERNLIWLGASRATAGVPDSIPFMWDDASVTATKAQPGAALAFVYPAGERLNAVLVTARTYERLLYQIQPFQSRFRIPDWMVWSDSGALEAGFFSPAWEVP